MTAATQQTTTEPTMSTEQILEKLLERISAAIQPPAPPQPIAIALWDTKDIAAYLHRSKDRVYTDIVCLPTFPKPIRLPIEGRRTQALYKAREVIAWAENYQAR